MRLARLRCGRALLGPRGAVLTACLRFAAVGGEQRREQLEQPIGRFHGSIDPPELGLRRLALVQQLRPLVLEPRPLGLHRARESRRNLGCAGTFVRRCPRAVRFFHRLLLSPGWPIAVPLWSSIGSPNASITYARAR